MKKKYKQPFFLRKEKKSKNSPQHTREKDAVTIEGTIEITRSGAAYLIPENRESFPDDIFISPKSTANALNGDQVSVKVHFNRRGRKPEGEVLKVTERKKTDFVGTLQMSKNFGFLVADDMRMHVDIFIPEDKLLGAKDGQKILVRMTGWEKWKNNPTGEVIEVLGDPGENETEIHSILAEFGLPYSFPEHLEREADKIPVQISEKEISLRKDFRKITTFTIDPVDAKDFDDAISFRILQNGNYEIGVHIADVTHYVKPGSQIEEEAQKRATSVYLVDRVVPMLPEILSNHVCSLRPNEEKLCFAAVFEMDHRARILNKWFGKTVINSDRRFTYEEAQKIIDTREGDFASEILTLHSMAVILRKERVKKGAISFNKVEVKFNLDEKANPIGVFFKKQEDSHKLIEEFMLLANRSVAEFCGKPHSHSRSAVGARGTPSPLGKAGEGHFVYRVHDVPNEEKIGVFSQFIRKFGYKLSVTNKKNISRELNAVLDGVKGKAEENMIETLAVRTMMKAIYTTKNIGHYGLAFDHYTHFTSPIRRYPDMMVHRLLESVLNGVHVKGEGLEELCKQSSKMEKLAEEAERASVKYKQVQFLVDRVGDEFEGIISGVTEWGIFVELVENKCEGMIRLRDMNDDHYVFDQENYRVVGNRRKKVLQLGDKVTVMVKKADLVKKQLDFEIV